MGDALMQACGAMLLDDPCVLEWSGERWLLTHGDALCIADTEYMQFRAMVRTDQWKSEFLNKPLAERLALARNMRTHSEVLKQSKSLEDYADADTALANAWMDAGNAANMIHGHTHRPATHALGGTRQRYVLSDWDCFAPLPRAEVLRLHKPTSDPASLRVARISPLNASRPLD